MPDKVAIGTILYHAYHNLVFNLCYMKITLGKFYFIKFITVKAIATRILYFLLGVSRIAVKIIKIIIKIDKDTSLEEILFMELYRPNDLRIILKINGEWCVNGKFSLLIEKINIVLTTKNTHLDKKAIDFIAKKILKSCEDLSDIKNETLTYSAKFIANKSITPHWVFPESTKNKTYNGYQTDKLKADANSNYGKKIVINQFEGKSKKSTLLIGKSEEFKQISSERKVPSIGQAMGALHHGYSEDIISNKYKITITEIKEIESTIEVALKVAGLKNTEELKKEILEMAIKSISD